LDQIPHRSNQKFAATDSPYRLLGEQAYCVRVNSFELTAHDARSLLLDKHSIWVIFEQIAASKPLHVVPQSRCEDRI
jgi:hypothetical protein